MPADKATNAPDGERVVLADRDGTLIRECHYLSDPDQVELLPGVMEGMNLLRKAGWGVVMVTNQSGIGRGLFSRDRVEQVHRRLNQSLGEGGVSLRGIYICPHRPGEGCRCRKPGTGLVELAAAELGFAPQDCWMIGDKECDIELGQRVGALSILVTTGYGQRTLDNPECRPDFVAGDFAAAARIVTGGCSDRSQERR